MSVFKLLIFLVPTKKKYCFNGPDNRKGTEIMNSEAYREQQQILKFDESVAKQKLMMMDIGPKGATLLVEALINNETLTDLNLSGKEYPCHSVLNFPETSIGDEGAHAFAEAMENICSLQKLNLTECSISESAAEKVLEKLPLNPGIQQLLMQGEKIWNFFVLTMFQDHKEIQIRIERLLGVNPIAQHCDKLLTNSIYTVCTFYYVMSNKDRKFLIHQNADNLFPNIWRLSKEVAPVITTILCGHNLQQKKYC
jgi:hypothetical protein